MLKTQNLTSGYKNFQIQNINIDVKPGDFVGLIGPNGSGKTTLFKTLTNYILPKQGEVFFNKTNINNLTPQNLAQNIAVVSQQNYIPFDMKVYEYLLLGRIPYRKSLQFFYSKTDYDVVDEVMGQTRTEKFKNKNLQELSGGERQLVSIARALVQQPKLLLLDEALSNLDITHKFKIMNLLKKMNKESNVTIMVILHDLMLVKEFCRNVIVMKQGQVYKQGDTNKVFDEKLIQDVYDILRMDVLGIFK